MENSCPLIFDRRDGSQSPEQIVDELQTIISDVDAFLSNWFRRLDQCAESCNPTTTPDVILQKRLKELQNERILLEAKRQSDERQMREKSQQLTQAWLQLEEQQRKFLQMNDPQRQAGHDRGLTSGVAKGPTQEASPPATAVNAERTESSLAGDTRPSEHPESIQKAQTRDFAVRQFQQLRREIEFSRPNIDQSRQAAKPPLPSSADRP